MTEHDYKEILLSLCASLTLADHMGDVLEDVDHVLDELGIEVDYRGDDAASDIRRTLAKLGVRTLYGSAIDQDEDEEEDE